MINPVKHPFRFLDRKYNQFKIRRSTDPRPSSYPFISGDSFRKLSHHVLERGNESISTELVKKGDIIFIEPQLLDKFHSEIQPQISNDYALIVHNSDINFSSNYEKILSAKVIHCFASNANFEHEKLTPLPIGLENLYHYLNGVTEDFSKIQKRNVTKINKILYSFNILTNPQNRQKAFGILSRHPSSQYVKTSSKNYREILKKYNYVASPEGNGTDCHRTWEALYLDTIPIVQRSYLTSYFRKLGIPLLVLSDWNELDDLDEEFFLNYYNQIDFKEKSFIYMDYWIEKIQQQIKDKL